MANNIDLAVLSIGLSEKAKDLSEHLEIENANEWIYCDPDNRLYEALDFNKGMKSTFFSPETPYAFRDRIFGVDGRNDGLKDLFDVLSKWSNAFYIPPKLEQGFQQGGAFIFKGNNPLYVHYDASAGAHIPVNDIVQAALEVKNE